MQRATAGFLKSHPNVFCLVQSLSSQWVVDRLVTRKLDVGLVSAGIDNPYVILEPLMEHPLVCIMPLGHPLAAKSHIEPQDLDQVPFVTFHPDAYIVHFIDRVFETYKVKVQSVLVTNPAILFNFQLCRSAESRNAPLVEAFAQEARAAAAQISRSMLSET